MSLYDAMYPPYGHACFSLGGYDLPPEKAIGNVGFFGAQSSGKTTLMDIIMRGFLPYGYRGIVFDGKGDALPTLRGAVPADAIANLAVFDENACAWDLAADSADRAYRRALAYAFIPDAEGFGQHFWDSNARNILVGAQEGIQKRPSAERLKADLLEVALGHMGPESQGPSWTLRDLIIACSPDYLPRILDKTELGRRVNKNILTHRGIATDRVQDLVATLSSHLDPLIEVADAMNVHMKAGRTFSLLDFANMRTRQTVLRLALDELSLESWNPMLGIIMRFLSRAILARPVNENRIDFLLFADEVQRIAPVWRDLPKFMSTSRTKGCTSIVATQHFEGLREAFGSPTAHLSIADICKTHVYLRSDSPDVAEHASKLVGNVSFWRKDPSVNRSSGIDFGHDVSINVGSSGAGRLAALNGASPNSDTESENEGESWHRGRSLGESSGYQLARHVEPLLDPTALTSMSPPSERTGMSCVVRIADRKWHVRIHPEWIRNRSVTRVGVPEARLDTNELEFTSWTPEEEARFMPPQNEDFFAGIGEKGKPNDEQKERRWRHRNLGEGLGIGYPGAGRRRR